MYSLVCVEGGDVIIIGTFWFVGGRLFGFRFLLLGTKRMVAIKNSHNEQGHSYLQYTTWATTKHIRFFVCM